MGEWDCYCMLCCGPLQIGSVLVGDMSAKAPRKRDKRVRQKAREIKSLGGANDDDTVTLLPKPPLGSTAQDELYHGRRRGGNDYDYYEEYSYDPRIVTNKDVAWLDQCRTVGFNADSKKPYITGVGQYTSGGDFETKLIHATGKMVAILQTPRTRFIEACYAILAKRLGFGDPADIDNTVTYKAARTLCESDASCLTVDYGDEDLGEQFWSNRPGDEYIVTCPADADFELREIMWKRMPPSLLATKPRPDLSHKVRHDPLTVLPFDILYTVIQYLSVQDALNLMQASYHVCITTREPTFWKGMIRTHLAPWFWEMETLTTGDKLQGFDYKGLFLRLDKVTEPKFGMQGPFMGVANCRRIWSVCGVVADAYNKQLDHGQETEAQG
ncbi:hypothetical protein E8E11_004382 [Didymella keratinophila]|nr:hypothetical protein E8E11_004382 [Didymella keratinophila]